MPTDANGVTVSNGYADNNAPYDVATKTIANKRFQKVILYDGSGNEITFPSSVGQKAEAASFPVVLATEQDTAKDGTEIVQGQFTGVGVLKAAPFEGNPAWAAWPASENGIPYVGVFGLEVSTGAQFPIAARNTSGATGATGDWGLVTRSFVQGPHSSSISDTKVAYVADASPGASDFGLVVRIAGGANPSVPSTGGTPAAVALNTATLTLIMAANSARRRLYVYNTSVNEVGLRLSSNTTVPTINSVRIPGGASWSSDLDEWRWDVYAIAYTAAITVHVSEQT